MYNSGANLAVVNSTLSGNRANDDGGGVRNANSGVATLSNVTLTNNTADADASGVGNGGGVARSSGTVTVRNSLIAGNFDNSSGTKHPDCSGTVNSQGYNLIQSTTGCTITGDTTGNQTGVNPQLGPLANNGGPTLTHAPQTGSPAIDAGNPATPGSGGTACEATDQRGYARPVDGDGNGSVLCDTGAYEVGATPPGAGTSTTITYLYDNLYRLTNATYSTGDVFTYTYDAVGNRLTQTTITNTTVYTYDIANRLVNVGGVAQTWDANGNLLNDGVYTYTYDAANRLTTAIQGANTYTFGYNGFGDRMRQVAGGITTTYTLDLNAGLTQVLADVANGATNTYLYGNGRIAQYAGTTLAYFLGDALGSVRQLTSITGTVTLARSYEPYGSVMSSTGTGTTSYAFTGEWQDATNLLHLRARYLSTTTGRFLTRDTWAGRNNQRPMSFNAWLYTYANSINLTDPSGHFSVREIIQSYGLSDKDELIRAFEYGVSSVPGAQYRWAWLKLLMDAHSGDQVWYGAAITVPPFLNEGRHARFQTLGSQITVDGMSLRGYTGDRLNQPVDWLSVPFVWRNRTATTYMLNGVQYIDGERLRDLPDYRVVSADASTILQTFFTFGASNAWGQFISAGGVLVIDRYGYLYGGIFGGLQYSIGGWFSLGEGYVSRDPSLLRDAFRGIETPIPQPQDVYDTITGWCLPNVSLQLIIGIHGNPCINGSSSATYFYTPGIGGSVTISYGFPLPPWGPQIQISSLAWDFIDRIPGIKSYEVGPLVEMNYLQCK